MTKPTHKHGGALLADCLVAQGVERVFSVPGESFLAALDGMLDTDIQIITARQEGGAAIMAEATGKLTGKPGVAFVTRGPGATNASAGVHIAFQDSTPMVLFIGQVASDQRDREAFQEVDYRAMFGPLAKWVAEIDRADRIPEYISHAFHVAQSGRPGPVVLALPEDMLSGPAKGAPAPAAVLPSGRAADADIAEVISRLKSAERPIVIAGGGGWTKDAALALGQFAMALDLPVGTSFRCQDYLDNRHPNFAGDVGIGINPALASRIKEADVVLALGPRLGEMTTSAYTLFSAPVPQQSLIHIHADPNELGHVYRPDFAVVATPASAAIQLARAASKAPRRAARTEARADYEAWQVPARAIDSDAPSVQMEYVITHLNEVLDDTAILTNGAGNYAAWLHRYYRYRAWRTQLAPTSGSMGYGLPAAIAAKLADPTRDVICLAGDGCFQMVSQEFGTAAAEGANIVVLVCDNEKYGTIRMHQQKTYPHRPSGTALKNPDFAALARAHGGFGATVENNAEFAPALREALAANAPALLHLKLDPKALSPALDLE
ncbi:thiamine pyrophosphate-binding protein [Halocynthiibacter sp. C4]|uniref:thiamine pyrophosphate-binding protein n=1 Tax=Halocynthiibacter sp. C4 TaxID=2992758 RepID=UPI00237B350C|nr:thiamine pyrophosphate-binding protein [Halocynthiibacter sp. C4]MDE0589992.1 thiamine pyrophosphate-binding protein [Halocynthiibacter sp. C4]